MINVNIMEGTNKSDLSIGMTVEVNPQSDKSRKKMLRGQIEEILTNSSSHSHGILVKLSNGEIGRVKKIFENVGASSGDDSELIEVKDSVSLKELIDKGEGHFSEFKTSALWSQNLTKEEIRTSNSKEVREYGTSTSKIIVAKSLASFLNSDGGDLIIGVKENKAGGTDEIIGINSEFKKLKDQCVDGYRRMILDRVIKPYFPEEIFNHINNYLQINFETTYEKVICNIHVHKSDTKVFLNVNNRDLFFVRVDASTRELIGKSIVDYCMKRFV